jgi:hypothetical protein
MNIASVLKSDEKEYFVKPATGKSPAWCAEQPQMPGSILIDRPVPGVSLRSGVRNREEKRLTPKLLWIDMLTNALIVIVIASVSYFFIAARTIRPTIETSSIASGSEVSESR